MRVIDLETTLVVRVAGISADLCNAPHELCLTVLCEHIHDIQADDLC
jgi:hypothetical protein